MSGMYGMGGMGGMGGMSGMSGMAGHWDCSKPSNAGCQQWTWKKK
jgi:hypothetical protein